jgi:hypothetical protein
MDPEWLTGIGTLILAAATFTLALFAFLGMRSSKKQTETVIAENRRVQEKRYRKSLLSEILDWAQDAAKCGHETNMPIADSTDDVVMLEHYRRLEQIDSIQCFRRVHSKNEYIKDISSFFDEYLRSEVDSVIEKLNEFAMVRWDVFDFKNTDELLIELEDEIHKRAENLVKSTNRLLLTPD